VLRLANSAYFGFPRSVSTLRDALFRLGTNKVFQLVVAATVGKMAQQQVRGYDLSGGDLWDHLIGTAIAATKLAEAINLKTPDHTFTAALTHDIGKIVLGTFVEVNAPTIIGLAVEKKVSFERAEQEVLGIDHAEVGACLLEHWNLPASLVEVVRWHHHPENFSGDPLVVNLVHVANVVCLMTGVGAGIDALSYRPSSNAMVQLGIKSDVLETIAYKILNELMEVRKLFKLR
jgi:putative nucleotidyltransferase with HDIG domain